MNSFHKKNKSLMLLRDFAADLDSAATSGDGKREPPFSPEELHGIDAAISKRASEPDFITKVVLVDIDPCHVHVYWQVSASDLATVSGAREAETDEVQLILKVHDAVCMHMHGFIPWPPLEMEVSGNYGYRYIEIPDCGKTLVAELGGLRADGSYFSLSSSAPTRLPPAAMREAEGAEPLDLVVVAPPGSPPKIVKVLSSQTEPNSSESARPGERADPLSAECSHPAKAADYSDDAAFGQASFSFYPEEYGPWKASPTHGFSRRESGD